MAHAPSSNYHHLARRSFAAHTGGGDLDEWLVGTRRAGNSWRSLLALLEYRTDGDVAPALETVRNWHAAAVVRRHPLAGHGVADRVGLS